MTDNHEAVAAGGVVYTTNPAGQLVLLLIKDKRGDWMLPKGHLEAGETGEEAAVREILEETGIPVIIEGYLQRLCYPVTKRGVQFDKTVDVFLARGEFQRPLPATEEGIQAARWVSPAVALALIGFADMRNVVQQAVQRLRS